MEDYGILYVCATPIGNLEDITLRVLRVLKEADIIAAEDTRHTLKLLTHYNIKNKLVSYHKHNEGRMSAELLKTLLEGKKAALVTDAGLPSVSDPGASLIRACRDAGVAVSVLPGANAALTALVSSGMYAAEFTFMGFLPEKTDKKAHADFLERLSENKGTLILYAAPHHLVKTLKILYNALGERKICTARELTKKYEEVLFFSLSAAADFYEKNEPKGEFVLIIEKAENAEISDDWESLTIKEHVNYYIKLGYEKKDALKLTAKERRLPKSDVYKEFLNE
ncbi:ribosomal RNA small subunit methyltransferase I [Clostridia bacterium]|nr:ribosomal RNA small subunit methyltransferase I [Clostridia bacterium]